MDKHLSTQFDTDLNSLTSKVLAMGGMVEAQLTKAAQVLSHFDAALAEAVILEEHRIDQMEIEIDADCLSVIAMRQPIASDLRYIMAVSKITTNLERAADEVERIVRRMKHIVNDPSALSINFSEVKVAIELASGLLRGCLDAFAKQDAKAAAKIIQGDWAVDEEFRAFVRKLVSYMTEDPRTIKVGLDFLFIAKAVERIGDHSTNIAELVVFQVHGKDIRHTERENTLKAAGLTNP